MKLTIFNQFDIVRLKAQSEKYMALNVEISKSFQFYTSISIKTNHPREVSTFGTVFPAVKTFSTGFTCA